MKLILADVTTEMAQMRNLWLPLATEAALSGYRELSVRLMSPNESQPFVLAASKWGNYSFVRHLLPLQLGFWAFPHLLNRTCSVIGIAKLRPSVLHLKWAVEAQNKKLNEPFCEFSEFFRDAVLQWPFLSSVSSPDSDLLKDLKMHEKISNQHNWNANCLILTFTFGLDNRSCYRWCCRGYCHNSRW